MYQIVITVEDENQVDDIKYALEEAQKESTINFSFELQVEEK